MVADELIMGGTIFRYMSLVSTEYERANKLSIDDVFF